MDDNTRRYYEEFKSAKVDTEKLKQAEKKAGNLGEHSHSFMLILGMVKDVITGNFKLNKLDLAAMVAGILYVVSPVDGIPDILPVVGWFDDVSVIGMLVVKYADVLKNYEQTVAARRYSNW